MAGLLPHVIGSAATTNPCCCPASARCSCPPPAGTVLEAGLAWAVLPTLGWRWLLALSALPLLLLLALYPLLPESPVWLVAKGRFAEAEAVLQRVAAVNRYPKPLRLRLGPGAARQPAAPVVDAAGSKQQLQPSGLGPSSSGGGLSVRNSGRSRARSPPPLGAEVATASPGVQAPLLVPGLEQHAQPEQHEGQNPSEAAAAGAATAGLPLRPTTRHRLREALRTLRSALAIIFGECLRRTTLLLFCIW